MLQIAVQISFHSVKALKLLPPPRSSSSPESFWDSNAFETDTDLPSGWMRVRDTSGTYYWHIPTGTTQWEPPSPLGKVGSSMMSSSMSLETTPCEEPEVRFSTPVRLRVRQEGVTVLAHTYPLRSTLQESWAQLSGTDGGTSEGEVWKVSDGQSH